MRAFTRTSAIIEKNMKERKITCPSSVKGCVMQSAASASPRSTIVQTRKVCPRPEPPSLFSP